MNPCAGALGVCELVTYQPVVSLRELMLNGSVSTAPEGVNVVIVPSGLRTKPRVLPLSSGPYDPMISPRELMPCGKVASAPGTAKIVTVPSALRKKPSSRPLGLV